MSLYVLFNSVLLVASLTCLISFSCALGVIIAKKISDGGMPSDRSYDCFRHGY